MNRKHILLSLSLAALSAHAELADSTVNLQEVNIVSTIKETGQMRQQPSSVTLLGKEELTANHVTSLKGISTIAPNFFMPDYGSRLTSAVYIRGIGSRINTPAVGLYVDNIPYFDKSAFDFNFYDIERVDVMRGPQGVLYGRNTMGGLVRVYTKNPFNYTGTDAHLGYNTKDNHRTIALTHYHRVSDKLAWVAGGYYEGGDGFFRYDITGKKVDYVQAGGGRMRGIYKPSQKVTLDLTVNYDYTDEGSYPYFYTGVTEGDEKYADLIGKITNNHENRYRREMLNVGLNTEYRAKTWQFNSITSFQYLNDRMFMDQDFMAPDIYTLEQKQKSCTFNEELLFKSTTKKRWQWVTGMNVMAQSLHTTAPVTFREEGVKWLNSLINKPFVTNTKLQSMRLGINLRGDQLAFPGNYSTPTFGLALFHQSTYRFTDRLSASLGVRIDYEHQRMKYDAPAVIDYDFSMAMLRQPMSLTTVIDKYQGLVRNDHIAALPKLAVKYDFSKYNNVYASVSMGRRSGGYNLQMFSDVLQGAMMNAMKKDIMAGSEAMIRKMIPMPAVADKAIAGMRGAMPIGTDPTVDQVIYKPEYSWNYEAGTHLLFNGVSIDAAVFFSEIHDQQIARFAPTGLGRMMVNAGKSHSLGGEMTVGYSPIDNLTFVASYGFTHATFVEYTDENGNDLNGRRVPFVPKHTMNIDAAYSWHLRHADNAWAVRTITLGANLSGTGRIYWTENNNASQGFYSLLGARAGFETKHLSVLVWGKNLTNRRYNTFFFESAGRGYEQHAKPLHVGVDVNVKF